MEFPRAIEEDETSTVDGRDVPPVNVVFKRSDETAKTSLLFDDASDTSEEVWVAPMTSQRASTPSTSSNAPSRKRDAGARWRRPYEPSPVVDQYLVLWLGFFLFALSVIWPPLILLFAYIASKLVPYSFRTNDCPTNRRKLFAEFVRQDNLPESYCSIPDHIKLEDSYWSNQRGMLLHTITMKPSRDPVKAVVLYCHGYTDNVSFERVIHMQRMVNQGLVFCAIEYEGHGLSDGPMGLINDFNQLVDDVTEYAQHIRERFPNTPMFLMGESMGGAVAYSVYEQIPELIHGVVFVCPMCKISDNMLPPQPVIDVLCWLIGPSGDGNASWLGYLPIAPARGRMVTHKDESKLMLASSVPLCFGRNPRLATARELIAVSQRISSSLSEFDAPFLVVHGLDDTVTDPKLSQALYEESKSTDKSIRLYEGMWHSLMCGEPDHNADIVFSDCISWILERTVVDKRQQRRWTHTSQQRGFVSPYFLSMDKMQIEALQIYARMGKFVDSIFDQLRQAWGIKVQ